MLKCICAHAVTATNDCQSQSMLSLHVFLETLCEQKEKKIRDLTHFTIFGQHFNNVIYSELTDIYLRCACLLSLQEKVFGANFSTSTTTTCDILSGRFEKSKSLVLLGFSLDMR